MRGMEQVEPGVFRNPRNHMEVYTTVAYRVRKFRLEHPDWRVDFAIIPYQNLPPLPADVSANHDYRPRFILMRCEIRDHEGHVRSVGHAEEDRRHGPVNKTNAIENAETSALGRALANLGYCTGNYASADEVDIAIEREKSMKRSARRDASFKPNPDADAAEVSMLDENARGVPDPIAEEVEARKAHNGSASGERSKVFMDLLAAAQTISNAAELGEVMRSVREVRDDLSPGELDMLKPIILQARSQFGGG